MESIRVPKQRQPARQVRHKRPEPLNLDGTTYVPSSLNTSTPSPFCPSRSLGSAGRRAERNSFPRMEEDFESSQHYRAPYVEDSTSATLSRESSRPSSSNTEFRSEEESNRMSRKNPASKSPGNKHHSRRTRHDGPSKPSSILRPKSRESDVSFDSGGPSSRSSSNKTVRFKSSEGSPVSNASRGEHRNPHSQGRMTTDELPARPGSSPLVSRSGRLDSSISEPFQKKHDGRDRLRVPHGRSKTDPLDTDQRNFQRPSPGIPSPGYSNGAFSKSFGDDNFGWEDLDPLSNPPAKSPGFYSSFSRYFGHSPGNAEGPSTHKLSDEYLAMPEEPVMNTGGMFRSFFNRSKTGLGSASN